ncbi:MAG: hypothetical protein RL660_1126 [Bacteroidota bacterium]|jgi:hypothetical protein
MEMQEIKRNLEKVAEIIERHNKELDQNGSRFNIFDLLGLQTKEVKLHSMFIAALLNPKGSHTFGGKFLEIFVGKLNKYLPIEKYISIDENTCQIIVEQRISNISDNGEEGGQIDIQIKSKKDTIIIENKIHAQDQDKQLIRYRNSNPSAILIYLNLYGKEPDKISTYSKEENINLLPNKDFFILTYKDFVLDWLEDCKNISISKPKISETISQYINTIKQLTNQSINYKMKEEIQKLIIENVSLPPIIEELYHTKWALSREIKNKIVDRISQQNQDKTKVLIASFDFKDKKHDVIMSVRYDPVSFNLFFQYDLFESITDKIVEEISSIEDFISELKTPLKKNDKTDSTGDKKYLAWLFDERKTSLAEFEKNEIFKYSSESSQQLYVDGIFNEGLKRGKELFSVGE